MLLKIVPQKGVGPIKFGMTSEQVQEAMKDFCGASYSYSRSDDIDYFFGSALEVDYDDNGMVEFVGAQYYSGCGCDFEIYGIDPFDTHAKALFDHIASKQHEPHEFNPNEYLFREKVITLWESDEQYDYKGNETRPVYGQVGIGNEKYLSAIDEIEKS